MENHFDGFQVVVGVHVQHRVVLVIKLAVRFGAGVVTLEQVFKEVVVALGVAARVHGDKAGVLQKSGVNTTACAGEVVGHAEDDVVFEPFMALAHGQVVHRRGRLARVNRSAHHGHAQGRGLAPAGHERHRSQHRHGGLAYAHDVTILTCFLQMANELLHVVDVVVQVKGAFAQRHNAGIFPVGDKDLVVFEHGFDGIAQERGVVAGERCNDQDSRLRLELVQRGGIVRVTLEAQQLAKRLVDLHPFVYGYFHIFHIHGADAKFWFLVVLAQAVHERVAGRHALCQRHLADGGLGVVQNLGRGLRQTDKWLH